jgi:hypothetical protein
MSLVASDDLIKARTGVLIAGITSNEQELELWAELFSHSKENLPAQVWENVYVPRLVKFAKKLAKTVEYNSSRVCYEMAKLCHCIHTLLPKSEEALDREEVVNRVEMFMLTIAQDSN